MDQNVIKNKKRLVSYKDIRYVNVTLKTKLVM